MLDLQLDDVDRARAWRRAGEPDELVQSAYASLASWAAPRIGTADRLSIKQQEVPHELWLRRVGVRPMVARAVQRAHN